MRYRVSTPLPCRRSLQLKPGPADSVYWAISKRRVSTHSVPFGGTMRFRDLTLRFVRRVSAFSCLWLAVLAAAGQHRAAQPGGGQKQGSSLDGNPGYRVATAMP